MHAQTYLLSSESSFPSVPFTSAQIPKPHLPHVCTSLNSSSCHRELPAVSAACTWSDVFAVMSPKDAFCAVTLDWATPSSPLLLLRTRTFSLFPSFMLSHSHFSLFPGSSSFFPLSDNNASSSFFNPSHWTLTIYTVFTFCRLWF